MNSVWISPPSLPVSPSLLSVGEVAATGGFVTWHPCVCSLSANPCVTEIQPPQQFILALRTTVEDGSRLSRRQEQTGSVRYETSSYGDTWSREDNVHEALMAWKVTVVKTKFVVGIQDENKIKILKIMKRDGVTEMISEWKVLRFVSSAPLPN